MTKFTQLDGGGYGLQTQRRRLNPSQMSNLLKGPHRTCWNSLEGPFVSRHFPGSWLSWERPLWPAPSTPDFGCAPWKRPPEDPPDEDILLLPHCLPEGLTQGHLGKVLQGCVDGVPDGLVEDALHPAHEHLQAFDHGDHLARHRWRSGSLCLGTPVCPVPSPRLRGGGCWRRHPEARGRRVLLRGSVHGWVETCARREISTPLPSSRKCCHKAKTSATRCACASPSADFHSGTSSPSCRWLVTIGSWSMDHVLSSTLTFRGLSTYHVPTDNIK